MIVSHVQNLVCDIITQYLVGTQYQSISTKQYNTLFWIKFGKGICIMDYGLVKQTSLCTQMSAACRWGVQRVAATPIIWYS